MLTHLGAGNVGAVIRRHKIAILFWLLLSIAAGYTVGMTYAFYHTNADHRDVYEKTVVFSVENALREETANAQLEVYRDFMRSKECQTYVAQRIQNEQVPLWLGEKINLKHMTSKFPVYTDKMKFTTSITPVADSPAFTITAQAYYQKLAFDLIQYYEDYARQKQEKSGLGLLPLTVVSKTEQIIRLDYDDQTHPVDRFGRLNRNVLSFRKVTLLSTGLFFGGMVILILILCMWVAHFRPTINCRSELERYSVPILGETGRLGKIRRG